MKNYVALFFQSKISNHSLVLEKLGLPVDDIFDDDRVDVDVDVDVVELNRAAERSDELELSDTIKMNKSTLEP